MHEFLEFLKHLSPKSKVILQHPSEEDTNIAEIPHRLGRIQHTPNHSQEILHVLANSQSCEVKESTLPLVPPCLKLRASPLHFFKKNANPRSPGVVRVAHCKENRESFDKSHVHEFNEEKEKKGKMKKWEHRTSITGLSRHESVSNFKKNEHLLRNKTPLHFIKGETNKVARSPLSMNNSNNWSRYFGFNSTSYKESFLEYTESMQLPKEMMQQKSESFLNQCYKNYSNEISEKKTCFTNGDWYIGQFSNNVKNGKGIYYYSKYDMKFEGTWNMNKIEGKGNIQFSNGDSLECTIYDNTLEPSVVLTYSNSNVYTGNLQEGFLSGTSTMKYSNKGLYRGPFEQSCRHGRGSLHLNDSTFYEGYFENDTTNGLGVLVIHSNKEQCGIFSKQGEFGDTKHFPLFSSLPLDEEDTVYISVTAKFFRKKTGFRKNFPCGKFRAGKLEGLGYARYGTRGHYIGNFWKGKRHGWGRMTYSDVFQSCKWMKEIEGVYEGQWKDNLRHGIGNMKWPDGTVYEGKFRNDHRHNVTGKLLLKNGEVYEGGWIQDKMNGPGVLTMPDNTVFKGDFFQGYPVDFGVIEYSRKTYKGSLLNLVPHGYGAIDFENGDQFRGNIANGKIKGTGTMRYANGDVYEGSWENELRHGYGLIKYADGTVFSGQWLLDIPQGFANTSGL